MHATTCIHFLLDSFMNAKIQSRTNAQQIANMLVASALRGRSQAFLPFACEKKKLKSCSANETATGPRKGRRAIRKFMES